jgi:hypothetical protein
MLIFLVFSNQNWAAANFWSSMQGAKKMQRPPLELNRDPSSGMNILLHVNKPNYKWDRFTNFLPKWVVLSTYQTQDHGPPEKVQRNLTLDKASHDMLDFAVRHQV